jgi:hypothetical protein
MRALHGERVLYVDTTNGFSAARAAALCEAQRAAAAAEGGGGGGGEVGWGDGARLGGERSRGCGVRVGRASSRRRPQSPQAPADLLSVDAALDNISVVRPHSAHALLSALDELSLQLARVRRARSAAAGAAASRPAPALPAGDRTRLVPCEPPLNHPSPPWQGPEARCLLVVDSVSAVLAPLVGAQQHQQSARRAGRGARRGGADLYGSTAGSCGDAPLLGTPPTPPPLSPRRCRPGHGRRDRQPAAPHRR